MGTRRRKRRRSTRRFISRRPRTISPVATATTEVVQTILVQFWRPLPRCDDFCPRGGGIDLCVAHECYMYLWEGERRTSLRAQQTLLEQGKRTACMCLVPFLPLRHPSLPLHLTHPPTLCSVIAVFSDVLCFFCLLFLGRGSAFDRKHWLTLRNGRDIYGCASPPPKIRYDWDFKSSGL